MEYFLQQGHPENQVTAFVPQSRLCRPGPYDKPVVDQHLLQKLADKGLVVFTPARKVPGKNIVCYDDRYVVEQRLLSPGGRVHADIFGSCRIFIERTVR